MSRRAGPLNARSSLLAAVVMTLGACGTQVPSAANVTLLNALPEIQAAVTSATGYPTTELEVLGSASHLRISVSDAKLAALGDTDRVKAAADIVGAMEKVIQGRAEFAGVQEISVAIVHPVEPGASGETHTEDVLAFRKAPSNRFIYHVT